MTRSLFLFDMTFWLYLAALALYIAYLFARRPAMQLAAAGHPGGGFEDRDGAWASQLGQVATLVTVFGWIMNTLALTVQQGLGRDPHAGEIFCFRGRKGDLVKLLWHDGVGMSLYTKRLEAGKFISYGLCQRSCAQGIGLPVQAAISV